MTSGGSDPERLVFEGDRESLEGLLGLEAVEGYMRENGVSAYFYPSTYEQPPNFNPAMVTWLPVGEGELPVAVVTDNHIYKYCEDNDLNPTPATKLFKAFRNRTRDYPELRQYILYDAENGFGGIVASRLQALIYSIVHKNQGLYYIGKTTSDLLRRYMDDMIIDPEP